MKYLIFILCIIGIISILMILNLLSIGKLAPAVGLGDYILMCLGWVTISIGIRKFIMKGK